MYRDRAGAPRTRTPTTATPTARPSCTRPWRAYAHTTPPSRTGGRVRRAPCVYLASAARTSSPHVSRRPSASRVRRTGRTSCIPTTASLMRASCGSAAPRRTHTCYRLAAHSCSPTCSLPPGACRMAGRVCARWVRRKAHTVHAHGGASLVVVDPPWPNLSAQRAHRHSAHGYGTVQDIYDLWRLRPALETILGPDTLLAVWVTNAVRARRSRSRVSSGLSWTSLCRRSGSCTKRRGRGSR